MLSLHPARQRGNPSSRNPARIGLAIAGAGPLIVMGDGARLERVFENLIDNAISFSPDDGLITIAIVRENGALVVRVEDEGPGVPDEARDAIFRRFQPISPEREEFGTHSGTGQAGREAWRGGGCERVEIPGVDGTRK